MHYIKTLLFALVIVNSLVLWAQENKASEPKSKIEQAKEKYEMLKSKSLDFEKQLLTAFSSKEVSAYQKEIIDKWLMMTKGFNQTHFSVEIKTEELLGKLQLIEALLKFREPYIKALEHELNRANDINLITRKFQEAGIEDVEPQMKDLHKMSREMYDLKVKELGLSSEFQKMALEKQSEANELIRKKQFEDRAKTNEMALEKLKELYPKIYEQVKGKP